MRVFLENMVAEGLLARESGLNVTPQQIVAATIGQIDKIARESYPLHQVMSQSDIVFHAEGPGAASGMPWLSALNWLGRTADGNLRKLSAALFDILGSEGASLAKHLDIRLSGLAPGSLWMGVKLLPVAADMLPADEPLMRTLADNIGRLPEIIRFIDDEGLRPGYEEAVPDPALRDVQLATLYRFAPTGRMGIHTLEISSTGSGSASLSQRERVVLKEVIAKPTTKGSHEGAFIGRMQEADLDKSRMHLRGVDGVGTLRCVMPTLTKEHARRMFGGMVRAKGRYQVGLDGRPRLLFVEDVTPIEQGTLLPAEQAARNLAEEAAVNAANTALSKAVRLKDQAMRTKGTSKPRD
ncbi:MAG TPA: hypothetical protein PLC14_17400 [Accumulibacter sp.]|nr:hypothetical protein [Accumulibacter sp.]HRE72287.1 hypothetical protein [Accumulibacter sp.]